MKTLSFEQMSQIEGGSSPACRRAIGLLAVAFLLNSFALIKIASVAVNNFCGYGGDSDSTFN